MAIEVLELTYINHDSEEFRKSRNISSIRSPPTSDESNGLIERFVRTVRNYIRVLSHSHDLDSFDWPIVAESAAYCWNITLKSPTQPSPWEYLHKAKPLYRWFNGRSVYVKENHLSKHSLPGVSATFLCRHSKGPLVDYLVTTDTGVEFRDEHIRCVSTTPMLVEKSILDLCRRPLVATLLSREQAKLKEMSQFQQQKVFCPPHQDAPMAPIVWLNTIKPDGNAKSRLVVLGDRIHQPVDVITCPPPLEALFLFISYAAAHRLPISAFDISSAFLHALLPDKINTTLPPSPHLLGFPPSGTVVGLRKAVYGLRQSPRLFEKHLKDILHPLPMKEIIPGLYVGDKEALFCYVDDLLYLGNHASTFLKTISQHLKIGKEALLTNDNPLNFLGATISAHDTEYRISISDYAVKHSQPDLKFSDHPESRSCGSGPADESLRSEVQRLLGKLGWISRFDQRAAVQHSILASTSLSHPCQKILKAIQFGINEASDKTRTLNFPMSPPTSMTLFTDASTHDWEL